MSEATNIHSITNITAQTIVLKNNTNRQAKVDGVKFMTLDHTQKLETTKKC